MPSNGIAFFKTLWRPTELKIFIRYPSLADRSVWFASQSPVCLSGVQQQYLTKRSPLSKTSKRACSRHNEPRLPFLRTERKCVYMLRVTYLCLRLIKHYFCVTGATHNDEVVTSKRYKCVSTFTHRSSLLEISPSTSSRNKPVKCFFYTRTIRNLLS